MKALAAGLAAMILFIVIVAVIVVTPSTDQARLNQGCGLPPDSNFEPIEFDEIELDSEQYGNARLILGVAQGRSLPRRAAEIAIATALQESSLRNIDFGDEAGPDSRGLFQQRPQFYPGIDVMNQADATNAFLDRLVLVEQWEQVALTTAAQAVQRSAKPDAYTRWEPTSKAMVDEWWGSSENPTDCLTIAANGDLATVEGITVAAPLAPNLQKLLTASKADGINLAGWGYRDGQKQIELRRKHCGTSQYDIYEKPSGSCSPPTARPGRSQHEVGLAIDFTCNGAALSSRGSRCFRWLVVNAPKYGLYNLPSEPWHWSTTGN